MSESTSIGRASAFGRLAFALLSLLLCGNWALRVTPALASTGAAVPEALAAAGVAIVAGGVLLFLGRRRG